jgi:hypothetical protein
VDFVTEQHREHLLRAAGTDEDIDAWETLAESVEDTGENVGRDRDCGAEAKGAKLDVAHLFDGVAAFLQGLEEALDVRAEGVAGVGKTYATPAAFEELFAKFSFERLDASGDRRLGQLEDLRGAAERVVLCDLEESLHLSEIHVRLLRALLSSPIARMEKNKFNYRCGQHPGCELSVPNAGETPTGGALRAI